MALNYLLQQHNDLWKTSTETSADKLLNRFYTCLESEVMAKFGDPTIRGKLLELVNIAIKKTRLETDSSSTSLPKRYRETKRIQDLTLHSICKISQEGITINGQNKGNLKKKKKPPKTDNYSYLVDSSSDSEGEGVIEEVIEDKSVESTALEFKETDFENSQNIDRECNGLNIEECPDVGPVRLKTKHLIKVTLDQTGTILIESNNSNNSNNSICYLHQPTNFLFSDQMCAIGQVKDNGLERFKA